ncbi:hypothetical protein CEP52_012845 [Fusarium oligoseptatum]|uniref:Uncharacterized protein n=1 Tax=Fusarium oligoseptatum TaxID=2604345 RepID=A0A428SWG5_9HYPO|nr:hypothetical protein CEP52_012845 [Fusarium oligoseptatum]
MLCDFWLANETLKSDFGDFSDSAPAFSFEEPSAFGFSDYPSPKFLSHPDFDGIDFSNAKTSPYLAEGKGQRVYWRNCIVKVYRKGEPDPTEEHGRCNGWTTLPGSVEVTFGGQGGSIKEE